MDVNTNRDQLQPIELKYKMRSNWKILLLLAIYWIDITIGIGSVV